MMSHPVFGFSWAPSRKESSGRIELGTCVCVLVVRRRSVPEPSALRMYEIECARAIRCEDDLTAVWHPGRYKINRGADDQSRQRVSRKVPSQDVRVLVFYERCRSCAVCDSLKL